MNTFCFCKKCLSEFKNNEGRGIELNPLYSICKVYAVTLNPITGSLVYLFMYCLCVEITLQLKPDSGLCSEITPGRIQDTIRGVSDQIRA